MITTKSFLTDALLDLARLVPNPPHHQSESTKWLEWAGRAILELISWLVRISVGSHVRFASQTITSTPLLIDSRTYL